MLASASPSSGLVSTLAWVIPIGGLVVWILILPSTRALLRLRLGRHTVPEADPTPTGTRESVPSSRARLDDPEITRFDREKVREKFRPPR
jgi:hypothetical protein